jgi:hypothetical protein
VTGTPAACVNPVAVVVKTLAAIPVTVTVSE